MFHWSRRRITGAAELVAGSVERIDVVSPGEGEAPGRGVYVWALL